MNISEINQGKLGDWAPFICTTMSGVRIFELARIVEPLLVRVSIHYDTNKLGVPELEIFWRGQIPSPLLEENPDLFDEEEKISQCFQKTRRIAIPGNIRRCVCSGNPNYWGIGLSLLHDLAEEEWTKADRDYTNAIKSIEAVVFARNLAGATNG